MSRTVCQESKTPPIDESFGFFPYSDPNKRKMTLVHALIKVSFKIIAQSQKSLLDGKESMKCLKSNLRCVQVVMQ